MRLSTTLVRILVSVQALALASISVVIASTQISAATEFHSSLGPSTLSAAVIDSTCMGALGSDSVFGMSEPTLVDRFDGTTEAVFESGGRYSTCIETDSKFFGGNQPTFLPHSVPGIRELESFAVVNPGPGTGMHSTDSWIVLRVSPDVSRVAVVSRGASQVSNVKDNFVFVHETEEARIGEPFNLGVVTAYNTRGQLVGNGFLK